MVYLNGAITDKVPEEQAFQFRKHLRQNLKILKYLKGNGSDGEEEVRQCFQSASASAMALSACMGA